MKAKSMRGDGVGRLLRGLLYCLLAVLSVGVGCDATARPASVKEAVSAIEGIAERINRMSVSETSNNWAIAEEATCVIGDHDEFSPPVTANINCAYKFPISLNGKTSDNESRWRAVVNYREDGWAIDHIFVSFKFYDSEDFQSVGDVIAADLEDQPGLRRIREMWLSAVVETSGGAGGRKNDGVKDNPGKLVLKKNGQQHVPKPGQSKTLPTRQTEPPRMADPAIRGPAPRPARSVDDHQSQIKALVKEYYDSEDWRTRYRVSLQGDDVMKVMSKYYSQHIPKLVWELVDLPDTAHWDKIAAKGSAFWLKTKINGSPAGIYVAWKGNQWRVDWMASLRRWVGIDADDKIVLLVSTGSYEGKTFNRVRVSITNPLSIPLWATVGVKSNLFGDLFVDALLYDVPPGKSKTSDSSYEASFVSEALWKQRRYEISCRLSTKGPSIPYPAELIPVEVLLYPEDMDRFTVPKGYKKVMRRRP
jgi:hypothetical protein